MVEENQTKSKFLGSKVFWLIILLVVLTGAGLAWFLLSQKNSAPVAHDMTDAEKFKTEYSHVESDNRYIYASKEDITKLFEDGTGLVFLGFPECPWCQKLTPMVDEAARAENLGKIYYLNIKEIRANNDATYQMLVRELGDYLEKDDNGNPRIFVPDVSVVKDGKVIAHFEQESSDQGESATPDEFWTEARRTRAIAQLKEMINQIK